MNETTLRATQSDTLGELAKALCKAQAELTAAPKEGHNPHFGKSYANLKNVWDACRKPLTDNGLSVIQTLDGSNGEVIIVTTLIHQSGEWIRGRLALKPMKSDPQGIGSAISYGKRYSLGAMVGVCAADEDDDAESTKDRDSAKTQQSKPPENNSNGGAQARAEANVEEVFGKHEVKEEPKGSDAPPSDAISPAQIKRLFAKGYAAKLSESEIVEFSIEETGYKPSAMPWKLYKGFCEKLDGMKKQEDIPF